MSPSAQHELIERIHASATPLVLAVTGGGSGALAALLAVPGASATVLEAVVPYSPAALANWLGGPPDQACGEPTARAMAMAAFERARQLVGGDPRTLRGIGATASLASTRPKRGPHRVHVAWQSADATVVSSCELEKGARTRAEEEQIATQLVLDVVAEACGVEAGSREFGAGSKEHGAGSRESLSAQCREQRAPVEWTELLLGEREAIVIDVEGDSPLFSASTSAGRKTDRREKGTVPEREKGTIPGLPLRDAAVLFPGAFHPLHVGHERMAAIAAERCGAPVTWELSIINVDKPPLDFIEISDRLAGLADRRVLLSHAPTFVEKSALAPGCTFVVGADTIDRIADPRYYGGEAARRDAAMAAIAARSCRFLVFGRLMGERFRTLSELDLPTALRGMCDEVPEAAFRQDVTSTKIRAHK